MIPWVERGRAEVPGGAALRLMQRGDEFSIMAGATELMNSRAGGSEQALARLVCDRLGARPQPRLLVGGLGMGFTLRAALAAVPAGGAVTVAELVPAVIDWAQGPLAPVFGDSLADPRVTLLAGDVAEAIAGARGSYDGILLDVDNGPDGLSRAGNDRLYAAAGLAAARAALCPGGVLAVWSSAPDERFTRRLGQAGFAVTVERVRARGRRGGARHVIWLAEKPSR